MNDVDAIADILCQLIPGAVLVGLARNALGPDIACVEQSYNVRELSSDRAARCLSALYGRSILSRREIRVAIVDAAHADNVRAAYAEVHQGLSTIARRDSVSLPEQRAAVSARAWHSGSFWSRLFCGIFGLPPEFSGEANHVTVLEVEVVEPFVPLNELHDFQQDIRSKILLLLGESPTSRAIVALPTGAGKTRLMVETLLGLSQVEEGSRNVVWIAQHNELCEQAVQCFSQVWKAKARPRNRPLSIQRVWKGKSQEIDWSSNVLVGTPESLTPRLERSSAAERATVMATVIDEAHHALGDSYAPVFAALSSSAIFGITATPGSSLEGGTAKLRKRFMDRVLIADELGQWPVERLQQMKILAETDVRTIRTSVVVGSSDLDGAREAFGDLPASTLQRLGANSKRNSLIVNELLKVGPGASVLCFAPTVGSARAIAATLAMSGRTARCVDAESDPNYRDAAIADFRAGTVQFMLNYGVLATGFDAPRVDCLVLARPTTSPVLYEQMLGRGLRGPLNGGTAKCVVMHFEDDFTGFGGIQPMSYARFLSTAQHDG